MKEYIRQLLIKSAYNFNISPAKWLIQRYITETERSFVDLLRLHEIDLVLDVGANYGQYAKSLLKSGYKDSIESFEPLKDAFKHLEQVTRYYSNWAAKHIALGNADGTVEINVAGNSVSSSLLTMSGSHLAAAPESAYVGKESIDIAKLDSIFSSYYPKKQNIFLKIDTQGFEKAVLEGAKNSLPYIKGLQLEMSFAELYQGETLFIEMYNLVKDLGFELCQIEGGLRDKNTGMLLQADAVFFRP